MARLPALPQPRRWTGVILVVIVLVSSARMSSAQIGATAALLTAAGILAKELR
jgi:hypothetical protein